jgi:hypothetical protein
MSRAYIKGGTPVGSESLCRTCTSAHIMAGYRESERVTVCTDVNPNVVVPFVIYECTGYYDKNRPDWEQMQKLAIDVSPSSTLKPVGFKVGIGFTAEREEPETEENEPEINVEELPAALANAPGRLL